MTHLTARFLREKLADVPDDTRINLTKLPLADKVEAIDYDPVDMSYDSTGEVFDIFFDGDE